MTIESGGYVHLLHCPRCRQSQEVYIVLGCRLTADEEGGALKSTHHSKPVDHVCHQRSLLDEENIVDAVGTPAFDFAQRAAGEHLDRG